MQENANNNSGLIDELYSELCDRYTEGYAQDIMQRYTDFTGAAA